MLQSCVLILLPEAKLVKGCLIVLKRSISTCSQFQFPCKTILKNSRRLVKVQIMLYIILQIKLNIKDRNTYYYDLYTYKHVVSRLLHEQILKQTGLSFLLPHDPDSIPCTLLRTCHQTAHFPYHNLVCLTSDLHMCRFLCSEQSPQKLLACSSLLFVFKIL